MAASPGAPSRRSERPPRLLGAAAVVALEGLALLAYAASLLVSSVTTDSGAGLARGVAAYCALLGGLVLLVGASLWRRRSWSLGAALALQLLGLLLAATLLAEGYLGYALPLATAAVVAGACLLHPATRAALGRA